MDTYIPQRQLSATELLGRDLSSVVTMDDTAKCKRDCIDNDLNFCPDASMLRGSCCSQDSCNRVDICSRDIKNSDKGMLYWTCP